MIENIFAFESSRSRQRDAPLLREREEYLSYMLNEGVSKQRVRTIAAMLLHIIRLMELTCFRAVDLAEIQQAAQRWLTDTSHKTRPNGRSSTSSFMYTARNWFRFHNMISAPIATEEPAEIILREFLHFINITRGMSPRTTRKYGSRVSHFLRWALTRRDNLAMISLTDVDEYLETKRLAGCLPRTIASCCAAFRIFFRFAEIRGWNESKLAPAIHSPRIPRYDSAPKGPPWKEVRRLLDTDFGKTTPELRAAAIFSLCSIYALRG